MRGGREHMGKEKVDNYRAGYAAQDVRTTFLPTVVSTSGCIHGDLLCQGSPFPQQDSASKKKKVQDPLRLGKDPDKYTGC